MRDGAEAQNVASVLLVEDDANQRTLYEKILGDKGYKVMSARGGMEALALVDKFPTDIVIMDMALQKGEGAETVSEILSKNHRLPIIIHTAHASYRDDVRLASVDAFVVKSSDTSELMQAVALALASRRAHP